MATARCKNGHPRTDKNTLLVKWVTKKGEVKIIPKCKVCRRAREARYRAKHRDDYNAKIARARAKMKVSLTSDDPRHGQPSTYKFLDCRCRPCTEAASDYHREWRHRRKAKGVKLQLSPIRLLPYIEGHDSPGSIWDDPTAEVAISNVS